MHSGSGSQDTITYVIKRSGSREEFDATKLIRRSERLLSGLDKQNLEIKCLVEATVTGAISGIATVKLDELMAQTAAYLGTKHPDYASLAGRLSVTALHKITPGSFSEAIEKMYRFVNPKTKQHAPLVSKELYEIVCSHAKHFDSVIQIDRDLLFDYFGFKTLERSYLISVEDANGARIPIERPQYMWLRVSIGIHHDNFERIEETYHAMSRGFFTHASPTLFNAGTNCPQMSSCFLVALKDDSIEGIYDTLTECALISKSSGGIGLHIHNLRATHSYIRGTNGKSNGIVPVLRVFNDTSRYVDQGGGKRKGSFAIYLEPWHADIVEFLQLKKNTGKDELRARDLFYALWIPDLFMKRVMEKGKWTLFDPNTAPGLSDCWGSEFERLYETYEQEERGVRVVEAQEIWFAIIESQIETGTPYMLYKDSCNAKSNQQNLGTIKCSNLCTEIIEFTSPEETAVCNLASIALPKFCVRKGSSEGLSFDFEELRKVTRIATRNLNCVIDRNYYPVPSARRSNLRHRPIGLGVQGLADVFMTLRLPFTSPDAQQLNEDIFETIYYAALEESCVLAQEEGTYESYQGSPVSKGILQHDMWGKKPRTSRWDWNRLRADIAQHGVRNSLLVAPMPTASTSQILGNNECFEPYTSNIYLRRVLSGEFPIVNKFLVRDLIKEGLWNDRTRNAIIASNGSVQKIEGLSSDLKNIYRTVWEIKQKDIIDMAAARAAYIDQSHSLNLFLENPTSNTLTSMHFYAWRIGLKTGMYYLRTRPAADAIKFTVDVDMLKQSTSENQTVPAADEPCLSCGS